MKRADFNCVYSLGLVEEFLSIFLLLLSFFYHFYHYWGINKELFHITFRIFFKVNANEEYSHVEKQNPIRSPHRKRVEAK